MRNAKCCTSRAEYRLFLREDNAEDRLSDIGIRLGLISPAHRDRILSDRRTCDNLYSDFQRSRINVPGNGGSLSVAQAARRPELSFEQIYSLLNGQITSAFPQVEKVLTRIKYEGYLKRQESQVKRFKSLESMAIPERFDYNTILGLKNEAREKLLKVRPVTLGQASRISGMALVMAL